MSDKTILIVDDEVVVTMNLQAILTDLGYNVIPKIITSGTEAVNEALIQKPDLVLMDIRLSDAMDGIDAAAEIVHALEIPIVYLTAYADEETIQRAALTEPCGYVLKPFEARELKANLEIAFYKHEVNQLLKESEEWLLSVLTSISDGVVATDANGDVKFMNPIAETLTGWAQAEAIGKSPDEVLQFVHEATRQPIENPILIAINQGEAVHLPEDTLLISKAGQETPVADIASPIYRQLGSFQGAVMVFRDITSQRTMEAELTHNALHDSLTQLPNRDLFFDRLQHAVNYTKRSPEQSFAVMLLDLDRFKLINDTLGHLVGDQLLVALAPRLERQIRITDTVARLGGDEFVILMEDIDDPKIVSDRAERLIEAIRQPITIDNHEMTVTASIGIVLSSIPYENAADLLRDADIAMYRAKDRGGNRYELFDSVMHRQVQYLMNLEHGLRRALANEEFVIEYQPIVDLSTSEVYCFEALVRWQKPDGERVLPDQFIPLAEEVGLIRAIEHWVFQAVCHQLDFWQAISANQPETAVRELPLSVNISGRQFAGADFLEALEQTLQATGIEGRHLKIEVTESVFIENIDQAARIFETLKSWGIQICLDDFGTGYSSLSYLHRLPIDIVKIDRSFIQKMSTDSDQREIVSAIIGLCQTLGKRVIAEGIETQLQKDLLIEMNCEYGQGYLFSSPVSAVHIDRLMTSAFPNSIVL